MLHGGQERDTGRGLLGDGFPEKWHAGLFRVWVTLSGWPQQRHLCPITFGPPVRSGAGRAPLVQPCIQDKGLVPRTWGQWPPNLRGRARKGGQEPLLCPQLCQHPQSREAPRCPTSVCPERRFCLSVCPERQFCLQVFEWKIAGPVPPGLERCLCVPAAAEGHREGDTGRNPSL